MSVFLAELVGTSFILLFGSGSVAAVVLKSSKVEGADWNIISWGWGLGVMLGIYAAGNISGAHINPAVTIGLASAGLFPWSKVPIYILGQLSGAFIGSTLVWLAYYKHFEKSDDSDGKLAIFSTGPAIRNYKWNLVTEIIGTFILVFAILMIGRNDITAGVKPFIIGLLIVALGNSFGGPTGYAINPARDLGPRIAHFILPIHGKRDSDWEYSWVPIVGPIVGGVLGALLFVAVY